MDLVQAVEAEQMKENADNFRIGDTVKVHFKIDEGQTERIQVFQCIVLSMKSSGVRKTFIVRKMSYGVGVERVFPVYSPRIDRIEVVRRGRVRRAKLYYLRKRVGKAAKVNELIRRRDQIKKAGE